MRIPCPLLHISGDSGMTSTRMVTQNRCDDGIWQFLGTLMSFWIIPLKLAEQSKQSQCCTLKQGLGLIRLDKVLLPIFPLHVVMKALGFESCSYICTLKVLSLSFVLLSWRQFPSRHHLVMNPGTKTCVISWVKAQHMREANGVP